jgi:predicted esterase
VFVTAPQPIQNGTLTPSGDETHSKFAWWFASDDGLTYRHSDTSLAYLASVLTTQGPFDGVFGFSQGGCCAAVLAAALEQPDVAKRAFGLAEFDHPPLRFCVSLSGFPPRATAFQQVLGTYKATTKALFVAGRSDQLLPVELTEKLAALFNNASMHYHVDGHVIPQDAEFISALETLL